VLRGGPELTTYTFYACKTDGVSVSFVTFDLESDVAAREQAILVLEDHASCAYVETWAGERRVLTLRRPPEPSAGPLHPRGGTARASGG
jgi:hypothetical protein